jgi:hypothetical protein
VNSRGHSHPKFQIAENILRSFFVLFLFADAAVCFLIWVLPRFSTVHTLPQQQQAYFGAHAPQARKL